MGTALFTLVNLEESGPLTTDDRSGLCALCLCVEWPPPHYHRVSVCWVTPLPIFMPPLHKENDLLCELSVISLSLSLSSNLKAPTRTSRARNEVVAGELGALRPVGGDNFQW